MDAGFVAVGSVLIATIVWKATDLLKYAVNGKLSAAVTQLAVWLIGVGATFLVGETDFATTVQITGTVTLDDLDNWGKVVAGLGAASLGSGLYDFKRARDNTDTAIVPSLISHDAARHVSVDTKVRTVDDTNP
jgi:hypothetical protein